MVSYMVCVGHFRVAPQTGMKPPTISVDPDGQEGQAAAPVESRPHVVAGPFKIDTSKYAMFI